MQVKFTETVLRDANQSLVATRMPMGKFESILNTIDEAGYYSVECWGGATFDACIRYLNEDPWIRLAEMRKAMPNSKLQMLLRGQSLLGYKHYPDDVVRKFVYNSVDKGIDIIRIFDALNDVNNIIVAVEETLRCGAHPSCAISYTTSPVHNIENYINLAINMEKIGAKSICIKDMSGILTPKVAYDLVTGIKKNVKVPIILHTHCSTGLAYMTYIKAIEAGVDVIDTAISSFSGGTSQPATEVMARTANELGYEVNLDFSKLAMINNHFRVVRDEFVEKGAIDLKVMSIDSRILENQIPGGMYSNLISQLKSQNLMDRFDEVLEEIPDVRKDLGYPPLVTPISQMIGAQATANVVAGERYKVVLAEIKAYFRGEYGKPPGKVNLNLMKKLVGKNNFPKIVYSKKLKPIYERTKKEYEAKGYGRSDILTTILFPDYGRDFIERHNLMSNKSYMYVYSNKEDVDANNSKKLKQIEPDNETKAVIMAILAYKLKKPISNVKIKAIYEMD